MDFNDIEKYWDKAVAFHGHACPGLAIGCRMALAAMQALGITDRSHDEEIICIAECDACSIDAVQVLLGCTMGKGNLFLKMRGKHAMTFMHKATQKAIRVQWIAPMQSPPQGATAQTQAMDRESRQKFFLSAADELLLRVAEVPFMPPAEARISPSLLCHQCQELTAEPYVRLHKGHILCLDCFQSYSRVLD